MIEQIKTILRSCPKNQRKKFLTEEMIEWLNTNYPVEPFSYQCQLVMSDSPIPRCPVCGNIPKRGKVTCSPRCREKLKERKGQSSIEKMRVTLKSRYGVENAAKMKSTQEKRIQTNIGKYGSKVSEKHRESARKRSPLLNEKGRKTLQERYGVINPSQLEDHHDKRKATLKKNYGVENYFHSEEWMKRRENRRFESFAQMLSSHAKVIAIHSPSNDLKEAYANPNYRLDIECNDCGYIETLATETLRYRLRTFGVACGKCLKTNKGSVAENQIADFLSSYVEIERNNRTIIAPYELDIVVKDQNIAIEYCGLYWHNDKRIDREYHHQKMKLCKEKGFTLITIFEDEWVHKPEIVKARLLHKLNLVKDKIYARKTECNRIEPSLAREFCEQYHIQGYHNASVSYGLFYANRLVAVMTFRAGDASKKQTTWELSRFCSLPNVTVIGAASKLFKRFILDFSVDQVVTFSDLRWNDGKVYENLGFKFVSHSGVNYWYVDGNKRIHRYNLRKTGNDDQSKTEFQLRDEEGWNRIWDCGNFKFVWTRENVA